MPQIAILDIDGTLVDTNYHHAVAWFRAFRQHGITVPLWEIHTKIGIGGDQFVAAVTDEATEEEHGDDIRATEHPLYMALIEEIEPFEGARDLIVELKERGFTVVLASSAKQDEADHYIDQLDARELADDWTVSDDVEATKPEPDLVHAAIEKAGGGEAVLVGDTPWDIKAASKAGVPTLAVMTGGFSRDELREAGAAEVFSSISELLAGLDDTALSSPS
jgi:HAD superfamily hydrolase (TIGR01549 family)